VPVVAAGTVAALAGGSASAAGLVWVLSGAVLVQLSGAVRARRVAPTAPSGPPAAGTAAEADARDDA
ncbi:MAG: hypothetical protein ACTMID_07875, partial [Cellulosimicrobium funkei]